MQTKKAKYGNIGIAWQGYAEVSVYSGASTSDNLSLRAKPSVLTVFTSAMPCQAREDADRWYGGFIRLYE